MLLSAKIFLTLLALLPPCAAEDSQNCGWNASTQGNGVGTSFVDLGGRTYYSR